MDRIEASSTRVMGLHPVNGFHWLPSDQGPWTCGHLATPASMIQLLLIHYKEEEQHPAEHLLTALLDNQPTTRPRIYGRDNY